MLGRAQPAHQRWLSLLHALARRGRGVREVEGAHAARRPGEGTLPVGGDPRWTRPTVPAGAGRAHRAGGTACDAAPVSRGEPRLQQHSLQVPSGDGRLDARAPRMKVSLNVNGKAREIDVPRRTTLLAALRDDLGLVGTRYGCGAGQCGACFV